MRVLLVVIGIISSILGLALSILPFGNIALIPIIIAFVTGLLAMNMIKKEQGNNLIIKIIFLLAIIGLGMTIYRAVFDQNVVEDNTESIERDKQSEEDAIEELEVLEID